MTKEESKPTKLIPAAKLFLQIIKENSKNEVCVETNQSFAEMMECSVAYIEKLVVILKKAGKIEAKRVGSTRREIRVLK